MSDDLFVKVLQESDGHNASFEVRGEKKSRKLTWRSGKWIVRERAHGTGSIYHDVVKGETLGKSIGLLSEVD